MNKRYCGTGRTYSLSLSLSGARVRRLLGQVVSAVVAAALLCSLVPAASFASEQQNATAPAANSASARASQVSITVPAVLDFSQEGDLFIQEKDTWGTLSCPVKIANGSGDSLYLSAVKVDQSSSAGTLANLYQSGSVSMALRSSSDSVGATGQVKVGDASTQLSMAADAPDTLIIPAGGNAEFAFTMDKGAATYKTDEELKAASEAGAGTLSLASLGWTFSSDSFFLQIKEDADHAALASKRGEIYSLTQVKAMADDISANEERSAYYPMFKAMVGDASEQYVCKVKFLNGASYRVRVVSINHYSDYGASPGLVFQFDELLKDYYAMDETRSTNNQGFFWSTLRMSLSEGDIWMQLPEALRNAIEMVLIPHVYAGDSGTDVLAEGTLSGTFSCTAKLFAPSYFELGGGYLDTAEGSSCPYLGAEGTQFEYYKNKGVTPTGGGAVGKGYYYWTRTMAPHTNNMFMVVSGEGSLRVSMTPKSKIGVCPCFCL